MNRPDNPTQRPRRCSRGRRATIALAIAAFTLAGCAGAGQEPPQTVAEMTQAPAVSPGTVETAERAIAEGRLRDAERILGQVLLVDPANTRARLALAEMHLADANLNQAAGVFGNLLDDPEVGAVANQGMGIAMLLAGIEDSGVAHLQRAVDADPSLWRAWNALGTYYDAGGQWTAASEAYAKALAEQPGSATVYNNRGFSLFMQGRLDEAIADLSQALRLDPDLDLARVNLRLALAWNGRYAQAMTGANQDDMAALLNNIGYIALLRGDLENAEAYLLRAMEVDPSFNEIAWRNLAYLRDIKAVASADTAGE